MKKVLALLLLWPLLAPAAQPIAPTDVQAALSAFAAIPSPEKQIGTLLKMESQLITFADGNAGFRFRYIIASGWFPTRACWFVPFNSTMQAVLQGIASGAPAGLQSVVDPANGRWFVTNALGPFNQADLDWCTN